jgi:hypothetical protein
MNIRPAIALTMLLAALTASTAICWGQSRSRSGAPSRHVAAASSSSSSSSSSTSTSHTAAAIPPGWGLAPGPASTVNHPGGIPSTYTTAQPISGIQPLIPTGTIYTVGPTPPRGRGSQVVVVPVYVPVGVYPGGSIVSGYVAGSTDPNATDANAAQQYPPDQTYAQAAPPPVYSEQTAPPDNSGPAYPPAVVRDAPPSDPGAPSPAEIPYTLLAFKDHSFFAVTDYWVENNRLTYVNNYGTTGSAALDQLDLSLTLKLNNDRGVEFELHGK